MFRPRCLTTKRKSTRAGVVALAAVAFSLTLSSCGGPDGPYAVWETLDGEFVTKITDDESLRVLRLAMSIDGRAGIPNGRLQHGDGGFNTGHEWHMVDVKLADVAIELCDGTAAMVDADVDYWVDVVGQYCPWDAKIVAITDANLDPWPVS